MQRVISIKHEISLMYSFPCYNGVLQFCVTCWWMLLRRGTGNGERETGKGERGTENGKRKTGNGKRGTGNLYHEIDTCKCTNLYLRMFIAQEC